VVYLALHPDGVSADRLSEALWPDQPPKPDTLIRNVAYARTALGRDSNGDHHLPRMKAAEGRYRLGPEVRCDLLELTTLSKRARESTDVDEQIRLLTEALALVRDKPFDSVIDYEWAWAENFVAVAEGEVEDAASLLSERLTHVGRASDADRARLVGLRGAPNGTRLTSTGTH
jgi:DNA-binding SARP family transcriptional activator